VDRVVFGVASDCLAGVEDNELRAEWPRRREDREEGVDDIVVDVMWQRR
jgi:hypothetical protein